MKDAILKTMSANEIVRRGCEPNVVQNVFNPNQVYSVNPNVFTFTITGSATGAKVIVANIDGQVMSFSTTAAQTAAAAATVWSTPHRNAVRPNRSPGRRGIGLPGPPLRSNATADHFP